MTLWITDSGASTLDIQSGVRAAMVFFALHNASPAEVWLLREADDEAASALWAEAETTAFAVAFAGWDRQPEAASLVWEG